ncbi:MAG: hypothetical protein A3F73_11320 [Gallionellales bacterium RIFCSPLOWO2_12_FULL_59_22]|nr:MAG: hypothetical protein A3H99_11015 [Gallionellales bacterium RIFCSPLOWO2_02_FULL_59_110]OGT13504.1 MAG: hypothetical protein A3F73_11320 [Gallionellales bacterium RIFCSPLOWO2_12_FULL_59_22]
MCFWLMMVLLAVAANKAQSEEGSFASDPAISAIQPVNSGADWLYPYRSKTDNVVGRTGSTAVFESGLGNTLQPHLAANLEEESVWSANSPWQISNSERSASSPVLRFESKGKRIEIKPRRHSIWVLWRKALN